MICLVVKTKPTIGDFSIFAKFSKFELAQHHCQAGAQADFNQIFQQPCGQFTPQSLGQPWFSWLL